MNNYIHLAKTKPVELLRKEHLLTEVVLQLKKDFELSGIEWDFELSENKQTAEFIEYLTKQTGKLIDTNPAKLQPLFYKIDISEKLLHSILVDSQNPHAEIVLEILKRELQKVIIRQHWKNQ